MINFLLLLLQLIISLSLMWVIDPSAAAAPSLAKPNCPAACGNVSIPYPFGIGEGCYHDEWYAITCNSSFNPKKPFLSKFNLEVLEVSLTNLNSDKVEGFTLKLNSPIASNCREEQGVISTRWTSTNFTGSPFTYSSRYNKFTVVGCDNALLHNYDDDEIMAGCTSSCKSNATTSSTKGCYGINCCQTSIPLDLDIYRISIDDRQKTMNCTRAFLVGYGMPAGEFSTRYGISNMEHVPVIIDWKFTNLSNVKTSGFSDYSKCYEDPEASLSYYECYCSWPYFGNPYVPHGCQIVEECASCKGECDIHPGPQGEFFCNRKHKTEIILGSSLGGGLLLLLLCGFCFWLYKLLKKARIVKLKKKFFKRNGGLLLQQQISSNEGAVEKTIVFSSKELEKATDNFNENRILGQGGQGTVYKGMLTDGKITAVKKSKVVDESQLEQFINEVVILSQINHRNIVNLLGCCLETEVPLLVYEFISNGNLFELIHDQNEEFPLSWKMRLQIATEVAGALAYLHSASSIPIYHRDIKSTNILLDEKYRAKVSDFGTSRSIAIEQTHLTTLVHGTFGYLDPEYFQSSQFTEKSDVYSYGVVLAELLTGQKPISLIKSEEERSLATRFISSLQEMRLFDLLDARVAAEAAKEEITAVADIARRCLSLNGKYRPTMKEVMMELEGIRMSHMPSVAAQNFQHFHENESIVEMERPADHTSMSTHSGLVYDRSAFSLDVDPLLFYTL